MANLFESKKKGGPAVNLQSSKTVTAGTSQITVSPDTGYDAMEEVVVNPTPSTDITPSNSSPVSLTSGNLYKPSAAGKAVASVTDITPSNSSPASMSTGNIYKPSAGGYAITSYQSKTPASGGTQFDAGMVKMSSGGYAYDSQQSGFPDTMTFEGNFDASEFTGQGQIGVANGLTIPNVIRDAYNYITINWQSKICNLRVSTVDYSTANVKRAIDKTLALTISMSNSNNRETKLLYYTITLSKT